jgi:hypothetical protein
MRSKWLDCQPLALIGMVMGDWKKIKNTQPCYSNLFASFREIKNICANVIGNDCRRTGNDCIKPEIIFERILQVGLRSIPVGTGIIFHLFN